MFCVSNNSPSLTWRDIQHLTVLTSKRNSLFDAKRRFSWTMNGVGLEFNHLFGFGVLDAGSMVSLSKVWRSVPARFHCQGGQMMQPRWNSFHNIPHYFFFYLTYLSFELWTKTACKYLLRNEKKSLQGKHLPSCPNFLFPEIRLYKINKKSGQSS